MTAKSLQVIEDALRKGRFKGEAARASIAVDLLVALVDLGWRNDAFPVGVREDTP